MRLGVQGNLCELPLRSQVYAASLAVKIATRCAVRSMTASFGGGGVAGPDGSRVE